MNHTHAGRASGNRTNTGTRPNVTARASSAERTRNHKNTRVPQPTHTPAAAPRNAHFKVPMSRAVCSVYQRLSSARRGGSLDAPKPSQCVAKSHLSKRTSKIDLRPDARNNGSSDVTYARMPESQGALADALSGRYRIDREIGAGGMATVYLAHDLKHDRDVAIKVLNPTLAAALGAERFA